MRPSILAALLLTACAQEAPPPPPSPELPPGLFAANGRDGLCIVGIGSVQRAGFIAYGPGDTNCSASGRVVRANGQWSLQPTGDSECHIPFKLSSNGIVLGTAADACSYYCAPGLSFAGKSFTRIGNSSEIPTDLAGDPLC